MKKKIMCFLLASIFCFSAVRMFGGCTDVQKLPNVITGSIFEINLTGYGGTPYKWDYEISSPTGIDYLSSEFIPTINDSNYAGGGTWVYRFKAKKVGKYQIKFTLNHVSDKNDSNKELIVYEIKIKN